MFGATLARLFNVQDYSCRLGGSREKPEFAVTRIRSDTTTLEKTPASPAEDAYLVWVSLTPLGVGQWRARYDGRDVGVSSPRAFATTVLDLRRSMEMWSRGPFDYLHYYIARSLLARVAAEHDISATCNLREAFFVDDLVIAQLTRAAIAPDRLVLDEIALLLGAHLLQRYCGAAPRATPVRRGLQGWQRLRADEMLRARLDGDITLREIADACSLSVRHFARCFQRSFGVSAHQYLIRLRLERAKALLLTTTHSLAEVASSCGFCDQPAFTRAFSKAERISPAAWRSQRR